MKYINKYIGGKIYRIPAVADSSDILSSENDDKYLNVYAAKVLIGSIIRDGIATKWSFNLNANILKLDLDIGTGANQVAAGDHGHIIADVDGLEEELDNNSMINALILGG